MRKKIYQIDPERGRALLARAPFVHLATVTGDGRPILKTVHAVVRGEFLYWHGSRGGEKARSLGGAAVVSAEEMVADIPSHWIDPERACPATTYYESVQASGTPEAVASPAEAAAALQALMDRYQPEGGHTPIQHDHPLYEDAIRRLLVVRLPLSQVTAKGKFGQNRTPAEIANICVRLWRRGTTRDLLAIDRILDEHPPAAVPPIFEGVARLLPHVHAPRDIQDAATMLATTYWNEGRFDTDTIARALAASPAIVGARCPDTGRLIAVARAISDGHKRAWVYDVCVRDDWRGRAAGTAVMRLLLDHPRVRGCAEVHLGTRDAQRFYAAFGFSAETTHMVLRRR